jgi:alkylation response protein AidB-like acyl-CoA dehydrogenase
MNTLELFRPTVGAATLGFARRALSEAVERSVSRTAFKKPISEHQLIQAKLPEMAVGIDAAALLVYRAAWQHDATERSISRRRSELLHGSLWVRTIVRRQWRVAGNLLLPIMTIIVGWGSGGRNRDPVFRRGKAANPPMPCTLAAIRQN